MPVGGIRPHDRWARQGMPGFGDTLVHRDVSSAVPFASPHRYLARELADERAPHQARSHNAKSNRDRLYSENRGGYEHK